MKSATIEEIIEYAIDFNLYAILIFLNLFIDASIKILQNIDNNPI